MYHRANVIYSWLYLTGKLQEAKDNNLNNMNLDMRNYNNNYYNNMKNEIEEAGNILDYYVRKEGKTFVSENKLLDLLKKYGNREKDIIHKLLGNNKIIENLGGYEIL